MIAWGVILYCLSLLSATVLAATGKQEYRVLFIGNSLTFINNLPQQFKWLANAGKKKLKVAESTMPSASLYLHTMTSKTTQLLASEEWTHVVLQEQSFFLSLGLDREKSRTWPYARVLANQARSAKVVLYETMGYLDGFYEGDTYEDMQQRIVDGYENLRQYLGCETAHAGKTFKRARAALKKMKKKSPRYLYRDYSHPSAPGTFLAAAAIYAQIFKTKTVGLKPKLHKKVSRKFSKQALKWAWNEYLANQPLI